MTDWFELFFGNPGLPEHTHRYYARLGGKLARSVSIALQSSRLMTAFLKFVLCGCLAAVLAWGGVGASGAGADLRASAASSLGQEAGGSPRLPRGKKLVLMDGSFQLVRSYERKGGRVRYYSVEREEWEEIPAAMVDWDATAKEEAAAEQASAALLTKLHAQEEASSRETTLDVDASIEVAPGVFLPLGEGMFVIDGRLVSPLEQAGSEVKADKKTVLKQVLSPIPIVPSKDNVELPGAKARVRISSFVPEFYLREAPPDPDRNSAVQKSSRPGEAGPEVELVRATVRGNKRRLESIRSLFGEKVATERNSISIQRWEAARTVYRFTLSQPLPPGEYALAEILPDGMNLFVWDFGVDGAASQKTAKH